MWKWLSLFFGHPHILWFFFSWLFHKKVWTLWYISISKSYSITSGFWFSLVQVFRFLFRVFTPLVLEPFGFHICRAAIWEIIFPDNHRKALPITFLLHCTAQFSKYISQFEQILFKIWTNTFGKSSFQIIIERRCCPSPFHYTATP